MGIWSTSAHKQVAAVCARVLNWCCPLFAEVPCTLRTPVYYRANFVNRLCLYCFCLEGCSREPPRSLHAANCCLGCSSIVNIASVALQRA